MPGCSTVDSKFFGSLYAGAVLSPGKTFVNGEDGDAPFWRGDTGGGSDGGGGDGSRAGEGGGGSDGGGGATWLDDVMDGAMGEAMGDAIDGVVNAVIDGRAWSFDDVAPDGVVGNGGNVGSSLNGSPPSRLAIDRPASSLVGWADNVTRFAGMLEYLLTFRSASVSDPFGRLAPVLPGEGAKAPWRAALPPGVLSATDWAVLADGVGGKSRPPGGALVPGEDVAVRSSGARRGEAIAAPGMAVGGGVEGGGGRW